jgi:hypothetical protein
MKATARMGRRNYFKTKNKEITMLVVMQRETNES